MYVYLLARLNLNINILTHFKMDNLKILLNTIIQTYFLNQSYCTVFVSNNDLNFNFIVPVITIKSTPINTDPKSEYNQKFNKVILSALDQGCSSFIVYNSNTQDFFCSFDLNVQITIQNIHNRKFIFIFNYIGVYKNNKSIQDILSSSILKNIPDFIFILPEEIVTDNTNLSLLYTEQAELFNVETYKIITREMDNPQVILLDYWFSNNQSFLFNANLFPYKVKNLYKIPFNVSLIPTYAPYIIIESK